MSFREIWEGPSFLNRKGQGRIWGRNDEELESKKKKKHKKSKEHYRKDWDKDLWDCYLRKGGFLRGKLFGHWMQIEWIALMCLFYYVFYLIFW